MTRFSIISLYIFDETLRHTELCNSVISQQYSTATSAKLFLQCMGGFKVLFFLVKVLKREIFQTRNIPDAKYSRREIFQTRKELLLFPKCTLWKNFDFSSVQIFLNKNICFSLHALNCLYCLYRKGMVTKLIFNSKFREIKFVPERKADFCEILQFTKFSQWNFVDLHCSGAWSLAFSR